MSHQFQRQLQLFQLMTGPPCTHSSSGAGRSAEAPSGRTSQARTVRPSATVVSISVRVPGSEDTVPGAGSRTGSCSTAVASRRTGVGGWSTAPPMAYTVVLSGLTMTSV